MSDVHLGPRLLDDVLDAAGMDASVGDELRQRQASHLASDRVEAAEHDRIGSVVDDEVDAGGLLQGPDVAALAPDDATLHLIGGDGHDGDRGLCGVVDHDPLDGGDDHGARLVLGVLAGRALDGTHEAHGIMLGLLADLLHEHGLGLLGRQAADPLEGLHLLAAGGRQLGPLRLELLLADEQLAVALLEHVRALVELLVTGQEAPLEGGQVVALDATLLVELTMEADLLLLGLEDELLLLGARLGHDALGLLVGSLDGLRSDESTRHETDREPADGHHEQDDRHDDGFVHLSLPSSADGWT